MRRAGVSSANIGNQPSLNMSDNTLIPSIVVTTRLQKTQHAFINVWMTIPGVIAVFDVTYATLWGEN